MKNPMLVLYHVGASYTEQEHREWLSEAGFVDIERARTPLSGGLGLMTARKPGKALSNI